MKNKIILVVIILIALGAILLSPTITGYMVLSESNEISVASILPMTGFTGYVGEYMENAMQLAVEKINSEGGINGSKLKLYIEDSQSDTKVGLSTYHKLSKIERINYFFVTLSSVTLAIAPEAENNKDLLFSVGTASSNISDAGDFVFRHNLMPKEETKFIAERILLDFGYKEIAIFAANTDGGNAYSESFIEEFEKLGGKILIIEKYLPGTGLDFRTQLTKIKQSGAEAVFLASYTQEAGEILNQASEINFDAKWFSVYAIEGPKLVEVAGENAEGLIYSHFFVLENKSPKLQDFRKEYYNKFSYEPDFYASLAYDSVLVLAEAIKKCANPKDITCVKNELYNIKDFEGVTGTISFNEDGDTQKEVILKTVKDGKFAPFE